MRWYSVKKYRPSDGLYLVRFLCDSDSPAEFSYETCHYNEGQWLNDYIDEHFWVTHFALIEPVEIDES